MVGKISDLSPIERGALRPEDDVEVRDKSDTTEAASGTNKRLQISDWTDRGMYVPERSLKQWRQTKTPVVGWFGDSTVNGDVGGFDLFNGGSGSAVENLGQMITAFGPFVGSGFYGLWRDEWVFTAGGAAFTRSATTDAWDVAPFRWAMKSTGSNTTFATFEIPRTVEAAFADIVFWDDIATATANWSYSTSTDGGATFAAFTNSNQHWTAGAPAVSHQRFAVPSGTTHIRIKAANAAAAAKIVTLLGIALYATDPGTAVGPQVHNIGASADFLLNVVRSTSGQALRAVWDLRITLAIIGPFTNDFATGTGYEDTIRALIQGLRTRFMYDAVSTSGSTTVTCPSGNFKSTDKGKIANGIGLGGGTNYVASVTDATTIELATAASSSQNPLALILSPNRIKIGTDLVKNSTRFATAATGNFTKADEGRLISGTNMGGAGNNTIAKVVSSTSIILTSPAAGSTTDAYTIAESLFQVNRFQELDPDILLVGQFQQSEQLALANIAKTSGLAVITGPAGTFYSNHIRRSISGTGIPAFATIASVQSDTQATMSVNATDGTTITATLSGRLKTETDDLRAAMKSVARGYIGEDGTAVDGDNTYVVAGAAFTANDVDKKVYGWGIQPSTYIVSVTNGTTVELSRPAIGDGTGHFEMVGYAFLDMGEAWYETGERNMEAGLLNDQFHESQFGHRELANTVLRCLSKFS